MSSEWWSVLMLVGVFSFKSSILVVSVLSSVPKHSIQMNQIYFQVRSILSMSSHLLI